MECNCALIKVDWLAACIAVRVVGAVLVISLQRWRTICTILQPIPVSSRCAVAYIEQWLSDFSSWPLFNVACSGVPRSPVNIRNPQSTESELGIEENSYKRFSTHAEKVPFQLKSHLFGPLLLFRLFLNTCTLKRQQFNRTAHAQSAPDSNAHE